MSRTQFAPPAPIDGNVVWTSRRALVPSTWLSSSGWYAFRSVAFACSATAVIQSMRLWYAHVGPTMEATLPSSSVRSQRSSIAAKPLGISNAPCSERSAAASTRSRTSGHLSSSSCDEPPDTPAPRRCVTDASAAVTAAAASRFSPSGAASASAITSEPPPASRRDTSAAPACATSACRTASTSWCAAAARMTSTTSAAVMPSLCAACCGCSTAPRPPPALLALARTASAPARTSTKLSSLTSDDFPERDALATSSPNLLAEASLQPSSVASNCTADAICLDSSPSERPRASTAEATTARRTADSPQPVACAACSAALSEAAAVACSAAAEAAPAPTAASSSHRACEARVARATTEGRSRPLESRASASVEVTRASSEGLRVMCADKASES
mmetsp:Transcript_82370/g.266757  ORF Transcript_82370/g.266757 Transcript_82370/m.266757 type:complete len:391 (+) Transcript_82370:771-1943(+)